MELATTHVECLSVNDEWLVLLVGEELRRVADVDRRLLLVPRQNLWRREDIPVHVMPGNIVKSRE